MPKKRKLIGKISSKWWPLVFFAMLLLIITDIALCYSKQPVPAATSQFQNKLPVVTTTKVALPDGKAAGTAKSRKNKQNTVLRKLGKTCDNASKKCAKGLKCAVSCGVIMPGQTCPLRCVDENQPPVE